MTLTPFSLYKGIPYFILIKKKKGSVCIRLMLRLKFVFGLNVGKLNLPKPRMSRVRET